MGLVITGITGAITISPIDSPWPSRPQVVKTSEARAANCADAKARCSRAEQQATFAREAADNAGGRGEPPGSGKRPSSSQDNVRVKYCEFDFRMVNCGYRIVI